MVLLIGISKCARMCRCGRCVPDWEWQTWRHRAANFHFLNSIRKVVIGDGDERCLVGLCWICSEAAAAVRVQSAVKRRSPRVPGTEMRLGLKRAMSRTASPRMRCSEHCSAFSMPWTPSSHARWHTDTHIAFLRWHTHLTHTKWHTYKLFCV